MIAVRTFTVGLALLLGGPGAAARVQAPDADFERLHRELCQAKEAWQEVPWRLSLVEARAAAARERKPVYMLVRSGHPLGCV